MSKNRNIHQILDQNSIFTVSLAAGSNVSVNTSTISLGNSTSNVVVNSSVIAMNGVIPIPGLLTGLRITNNGSDANHDMDIAVGAAASSVSPYPLMINSTAGLTKRVDASWAVGDGNGGLDTGSVVVGSLTTYHIYLIMRPDTRVVDACFSTNTTTPTLPSNYTHYRRIGSFPYWDGFWGHWQRDDYFHFNSAVNARNSTATTTDTLVTLNVPLGIQATAMVWNDFVVDPGANYFVNIGYEGHSTANYSLSRAYGAPQQYGMLDSWMLVKPDSNGQVRYTVSGSGTINANRTLLYGLDR